MRVFIIFFTLLSFITCKQKSTNLESISLDSKLTDDKAIELIVQNVYSTTLKSLKIEKTKSNQWKAFIEFGGSSALTFLSKDNYREMLERTVALNILKTFRLSKTRHLSSVRVSLVKPFYVNDPQLNKETIEEFEVFRVKYSLKKLSSIVGWDSVKLENENSTVSEQAIPILDEIRKGWKVELNEVHRVEVK